MKPNANHRTAAKPHAATSSTTAKTPGEPPLHLELQQSEILAISEAIEQVCQEAKAAMALQRSLLNQIELCASDRAGEVIIEEDSLQYYELALRLRLAESARDLAHLWYSTRRAHSGAVRIPPLAAASQQAV